MQIRKIVYDKFDDILDAVKKTQSSSLVHKTLAEKGFFLSLFIEKIDNRAAAILKQEALSCGAEVSVDENVSKFKLGFSDAVLSATLRQLEILKNKLYLQPFNLKSAAEQIDLIVKDSLKYSKIFRYKKQSINLDKPIVMGIINMDPNSFSGDGLVDADKALKKALEFEEFGAKIIDIGAESSRPGTRLVDSKTEIKRLLPALKKIRKKIKIPVSIDTYKYETAKAAIGEGADIINDIFALNRGKEKLAKLVSDKKAGLIIMHSKGNPLNMQKNPQYKNCTNEVFDFLKERREYALSFSIDEDFISIDPGIGFAKTAAHNLELIKNIKTFSPLGAVTVGVSRKNFVRKTAGENTCCFVAANFMAALKGADIIRVHDVKETVEVLRLI
jgi:dihydropteroate synthase